MKNTLTPFNHAVLQWIGEVGIATRRQLITRFWQNAQARTAYAHLYWFIQHGYLISRADQTVLKQPAMIYALTPQAATALLLAPPYIQVGWPSHAEYNHQVLGQQTRLVLEAELAATGGSIRQWRSERYLRHIHPPSEGHLIADAEIDIQQPVEGVIELVMIEIDGEYYGAMLQEKVEKYGAYAQPVIWSCLAHRAARIQQAVAPYPHIRVLPLVQEAE